MTFLGTYVRTYICMYKVEKKIQTDYTFISTSLFRGCPLVRRSKSPDEWATTKQACRDKRVVRLNLFSTLYSALLTCIEHCFTEINLTLLYMYVCMYVCMMYVFINVCVYVCICVFVMCVCVFIYSVCL